MIISGLIRSGRLVNTRLCIIFSCPKDTPPVEYQEQLVSAYLELARVAALPVNELHNFPIYHDCPLWLQNPLEVTERLVLYI